MTAAADDGDDMALPAGKRCADCHHFNRCTWLVSARPDWSRCDWSPSRFVATRRAPSMDPEDPQLDLFA